MHFQTGKVVLLYKFTRVKGRRILPQGLLLPPGGAGILSLLTMQRWLNCAWSRVLPLCTASGTSNVCTLANGLLWTFLHLGIGLKHHYSGFRIYAALQPAKCGLPFLPAYAPRCGTVCFPCLQLYGTVKISKQHPECFYKRKWHSAGTMPRLY